MKTNKYIELHTEDSISLRELEYILIDLQDELFSSFNVCPKEDCNCNYCITLELITRWLYKWTNNKLEDQLKCIIERNEYDVSASKDN